jgi:hypothetical protein
LDEKIIKCILFIRNLSKTSTSNFGFIGVAKHFSSGAVQGNIHKSQIILQVFFLGIGGGDGGCGGRV